MADSHHGWYDYPRLLFRRLISLIEQRSKEREEKRRRLSPTATDSW